MKKLMALAVIVAVSLTAAAAMAATDTDTLNVSANVVERCRIDVVNDLTFVDYDPTDTNPNDADTTVSLRCSKGTTFTTYITTARTITDGSDTLNYELYTDSGRTAVYPSAGPGSAIGSPSTSNAAFDIDIYGRIAAGQDVGVGSYSGTDTFTVDY